MKAFQVSNDYSIRGLSLVEKDIPALLPGQVLVKISALSLNYRDLLVVKGIESWRPPVGRIPVSDGVGRIVAKGDSVQSLKINDRVAGLFLPNWKDGKLSAEKLLNPLGGRVADGLLQEYAVFNEDAVIAVPDFLSDEAAATLPCAGVTAWQAVIEKGRVGAGQTVLIQGTGGVSLFAAQFALMHGAEVILLSGSDEKLARVRQMGVKHLINYNTTPAWEKTVLDVTNGAGVDHVIEVVGADHINRSIEVVALDGSISIIGLINGFSGNINTARIMSKQIRLQGIEVGSKEMFARLNQAIALNKMVPVIDHVYPFMEIREALTTLEQGKHFGKLCLTFN